MRAAASPPASRLAPRADRSLLFAPALLAAMAVLAGCGGVQAADLFEITRTGSTPHANLVLLVDEEGKVRCNGESKGKLDDAELVKARGIQEDLQKPASQHTSLAPRLGSVFSYSVRDENGSVRFADNSTGQPKVLHELALFVLSTSQQVCGLPE